MARETKVGLLIGLGIILLIGIVVGDHLAVVRQQEAAPLTDLAQEAQRGLQGQTGSPNLTLPIESARTPAVRPVAPLPLPSELDRPVQTPEGEAVPVQHQQRIFQESLQIADAQVQGIIHTAAGTLQQAARNAHSLQASDPQPIIHYVKANETLWQIALHYYGDGEYWRHVLEANRESVMANNGVRPGVRLIIPHISTLPEFDTVPSEVTLASNIANANTHRSQPTSQRSISVQSGDTLSRLAARHLGSAGRWQDLFEANRDQLKRPEDLQVGMTLRLPTTEADSNARLADAASSRSTSIVQLADNRSTRNTNTSKRVHVVRAGDTLMSIARSVGSEDWKAIYEANRHQLKNPNALVIGQKLVLP